MRAALAVSLLAIALLPAAASAAPDREGTVSTTAPAFAWDGPMATGNNTARDPKACSHDPETYCDQTLVRVDVPAGSVGTLKVTTGDYFGPQCTPIDGQSAPCDFSLWLYASDATGKVGKQLGSSINDSGEDEEITYRSASAGYYLVVVFYYTVAQSSYKGTATLSAVAAPPPAPAGPVAPAAPPAGALPASGSLQATLAIGGRVSKGALAGRLTCTVVCKGTVVAEVSGAQARKLGLGRRKLVIARASVAVDKTAGAAVRLKLSRRAAARLARARGKVTVTVRMALTDSAGGQRTTARRVLVLKR